MKKISITLIFFIFLLIGCSEYESSGISNNDYKICSFNNNEENKYLNNEINTEHIKINNDNSNSIQSLYDSLTKWLNKNRDKTIINLTTLPAQQGDEGYFITYKNIIPNSEYQVIAINSSLFKSDKDYKKDSFDYNFYEENTINFVNKYMSKYNVITAITINNLRGGVSNIILIVEPNSNIKIED